MDVVPAAPGTRAVIIGICPDLGGRRPTEADVYSYETPVVAWRVSGNSATPILMQDVSDADHCYVIQPNGSLLSSDQYDEFLKFTDLDTARAVILARAQHSWYDQKAER